MAHTAHSMRTSGTTCDSTCMGKVGLQPPSQTRRCYRLLCHVVGHRLRIPGGLLARGLLLGACMVLGSSLLPRAHGRVGELKTPLQTRHGSAIAQLQHWWLYQAGGIVGDWGRETPAAGARWCFALSAGVSLASRGVQLHSVHHCWCTWGCTGLTCMGD